MGASEAYHTRWMTKHDMPEIYLVDEGSFEQRWTDQDFHRELRPRSRNGMVAEDPEGHVVGFMVYEFHTHYVELVRFAVAPNKRRRGVGTAMLARLTTKLSPVRNRIYIDVPERMLAFELFLKACGVPCVNLKRGVEGADDTFEFEYKFQEPAMAETGYVH